MNDVEKHLTIPQAIYTEKNSQIVELIGVKIIWSAFRGSYKLIQEEEEIILAEYVKNCQTSD